MAKCLPHILATYGFLALIMLAQETPGPATAEAQLARGIAYRRARAWGAGVNLGLAAVARNGVYQGPRVRWLRIPREAIKEAACLFLTALPLFALASLFEFLA